MSPIGGWVAWSTGDSGDTILISCVFQACLRALETLHPRVRAACLPAGTVALPTRLRRQLLRPRRRRERPDLPRGLPLADRWAVPTLQDRP